MPVVEAGIREFVKGPELCADALIPDRTESNKTAAKAPIPGTL